MKITGKEMFKEIERIFNREFEVSYDCRFRILENFYKSLSLTSYFNTSTLKDTETGICIFFNSIEILDNTNGYLITFYHHDKTSGEIQISKTWL